MGLPIVLHFRRALLAVQLAGTLGLVILVIVNPQPPPDELPLRDVPDSEYSRAGIVLAPAYDEHAGWSSHSVESVATEIVCCGQIRQTVLVRLRKAGDASPGVLSYAISYDTGTAPEGPLPMRLKTSFTRNQKYFVLFLDASSSEHIYSLFPGSDYPFLEAAVAASGSGPFALHGVNGDDLVAAGIVVGQPPPDMQPTLNEGTAWGVVARKLRGAVVRQVVLAWLTDRGSNTSLVFPPTHPPPSLVWVANLEPDSLSVPVIRSSDLSTPSAAGPRFALAFVDAHTGEFLFFVAR